MRQVIATVISNKNLSKGVEEIPKAYLMSVLAPGIASIAKPGQFVMLSCGPEVTLRRPLSIHQIEYPDRIYLLFAAIGKGTDWLSRRKKGDTLDLVGPLGNGFTIEPMSRRLLLIGGGIGVSPLAFLAEQAKKQGKEISLLLGARTGNQLYHQRFPANGIKTVILTDDGSKGIKGKISDLRNLAEYIGQADQVFICGPLPMYQAICNLMQQKALKKPVQVSLETRMGCGIGTCYGCSIKTIHGMKTVCHDGPVFNMDEIIWREVTI